MATRGIVFSLRRLTGDEGGYAINIAIVFPAATMLLLLLTQITFWGVGHMAAESAARRGAQIAAGLAPAALPGGVADPSGTAECDAAVTRARDVAAERAGRWSFAALSGTPREAIDVTWENRWVEVEVRMLPAVSFLGWSWPITVTARESYDNWGELNLFCP